MCKKISKGFRKLKCSACGCHKNYTFELEELRPKHGNKFPMVECPPTNSFALEDALALFEGEKHRQSNHIVNLDKHKRNFRLAIASLESYEYHLRKQLGKWKRKTCSLSIALGVSETEKQCQKNELANLYDKVNWLDKESLSKEKENRSLKKSLNYMGEEMIRLANAMDNSKKKKGQWVENLTVLGKEES